ncbi:MAG: phospho-N-acetylmuramoyl-pentapeptide-transferase [Lachnospiraceae bacterium]|nr:phospho-N-acetylmuramoyl-pentapeptide-transferase [Lachnospiraceae bacterium]
MLSMFLGTAIPEGVLVLASVIFCLTLSFLILKNPPDFLPRDHGRAFAVNGELSKGKLRGVGLIMISVFLLSVLLFLPVSIELLIYSVIIFLMMLSGYLDDAAKNPWSDYKKGAIDLVLSILMVVTFLCNNSTEIIFFDRSVYIHPVLYGILGVILIWVSVNVTNCSDGVDGLCGGVTVVMLIAYAIIFRNNMDITYKGSCFVFAVAILAYLRYNWHPSTMLMGDAGSRAIGIFLALIAMKSGHPYSFLLMGLVFILDGGTGLVKVFVMRFLKIPFLKNIRCPLHDQMRKNMGWKDVPVVLFMIGAQTFLCIVEGLLLILL